MKKYMSMFLISVLLLCAAPASATLPPLKNTLEKNSAAGVLPAGDMYIILVQDAADSSPVPGAMVQFCSDTMCMVSRTDGEGAAAFEAVPGSYTAHILKEPEGYEPSKEEIVLTAETRSAVFALRKSGAAQAEHENAQTEEETPGFFDKIGSKIKEMLEMTGQ